MGLFGSKTNQSAAPASTPVKDSAISTKTKKEVVKKSAPVVKTEAASMKELYADGGTKSAAKVKGAAKFNEVSLLLVRPLVTEKATTLAADNKYVFVVANNANKISITKAIQSVYGVKPLDVNIVNMKGKRVSRGRIRGQRKDWKKAIVTIAQGEKISIYEGV